MDTANLTHLALGLATPSLLLLFLVTQVAQVVALYVAARLVAPEDATPAAALTCYGVNVLVMLGWAITLVLGLLLLSLVGGMGGLLMLGFFFAWVALLIWCIFQVPMHIFGIGAWRALLLLIVTAMISSALDIPVNLLFRPKLDPAQVAQLTQALQQTPAAARLAPALAPAQSAAQGALGKLSGAVSRTARPDRPVPATVRLAEDTRVPVVLDGRVAGDQVLERGTQLEVIGVDGEFVKVRHLDATLRLPKSKLDY